MAETTNESRDVKIEYYRMRLDHTQEHTLRYSRLIYMVNGGVLALMLGAAEFDGVAEYRSVAIRFGLFLIAVINVGHAFFVMNQRDWYRRLDTAYRDCVHLGSERIRSELEDERRGLRKWLGGSLQIYANIHILVGILSFLCGLASFRASG